MAVCCQVVLSGLSGTYSSYITTWEEYQVQRYEGASTAYGPHTLDAYIQTAVTLVKVGLTAVEIARVMWKLSKVVDRSIKHRHIRCCKVIDHMRITPGLRLTAACSQDTRVLTTYSNHMHHTSSNLQSSQCPCLREDVMLVVPQQAMLAGEPVTSDVRPPDLEASQISLLPPVVLDGVPCGTHFGDLVVQPLPTYIPGQVVEAVFR